MLIDHVNLNQLRVFECVYRTRSMTAAAQELHLTQSGVSQHIKALEDMLGTRLLDRIQQKLIPTTAATQLFKRCSSGLAELEKALTELKDSDKRLSGTVAIGMPIEFGNNVVIPLLSKLCRDYPLVRFKVRLGFASAMNEQLLRGELDFAFTDDFPMDRRIKTERIYDEVLELCASARYLATKGAPKNTRKYFETLDYVEYQEGEPILRMWFAHHLNAEHLSLNVRTTIMDVQGIARLILTDAGVGVLPTHLVAKLQREGHRIHLFKGCGKPMKNSISVAYLAERSHSPATLGVLDTLREQLSRDQSCLKAPSPRT
ncbi:MAG: LysR family transcriptional regulator [Oligoflexia bacterium]|nr:LysR family transcriptional regulator [Oligoflexia bacterium]